MIKFICASLVVFSFQFANATSPAVKKDCVVLRAAFDVGSAATRMKIAEVDTCVQTIEKILFEAQEEVGYKEDLTKHDGQFSTDIQKAGKAVFATFKKKADELKVPKKNRVGVATAAFREAKNAEKYLKEVAKETGIQLSVISQDEEAQLGFFSAMTEIKTPPLNLVVWDIGGGSMQLTARNGSDFIVFQGDLASVTFKNRIIQEIEKSKAETPNPMSPKVQDEAVKMAEAHAAKNVNEDLKKKIVANQGKVYAVGSVHGISVKTQTGDKETYTLADVTKALKSQGKKTDEQIGGKYASTDVSNLALVAGYMKALSIKEVQVVKVNNANGALVNPKYWVK